MHKEDETDVQGIHFKGLKKPDLELSTCTAYKHTGEIHIAHN